MLTLGGKPNTQVSVPLRLTLTSQGMADSAVCSSSWPFLSGRIPSDEHLQTWSLRRRCSASYLTDSALSAQCRAAPPISSPGQHKGQATKAKLAQKGKCPRLSFTFNPNRIQCEKQHNCFWGRGRGVSCWPPPGKQGLVIAMVGSWLHVTWHALSHEDAGLWQWQWGDLSLLQLIRKVILCFQYETFHSKIQFPDSLDSVFTHF